MGSGGANITISNNAAPRGGRSFVRPVTYSGGRKDTPGTEQAASDAVRRRLESEFREALRRNRIRSRLGLAAGIVAVLILLAYGWWA